MSKCCYVKYLLIFVFETSECILSEAMYVRLSSCKFDVFGTVNSKFNLTMMVDSIVHKSILFKLDNGFVSFEVLEMVKLSDGFCQKRFQIFLSKKGKGVSILRVGSGSLLSRQSVRRTNIQLLSGD